MSGGTAIPHATPTFSSYWQPPSDHIPTTAEQLARDLGNPTREGREWRCLCPAHDDHDPSLSIRDGDNGKPVFRCRAGCEQEQVIAALVKRGLWHEAPANGSNGASKPKQSGHADKKPANWHPIVPPPAGTQPPPPSQLRCDTLHIYRDAAGEILLYVKRIEAKGERKKLFVPVTFGTLDGKTGWHDKHPRVPKPLYGLDRRARRNRVACGRRESRRRRGAPIPRLRRHRVDGRRARRQRRRPRTTCRPISRRLA